MNTSLDKLLAVLLFILGLLFLLSGNSSGGTTANLTPCRLSSVEEVKNCLLTNRRDATDFSNLLQGESVLIFGETYLSVDNRFELMAALPALKNLGFTRLALEAMPSSRQSLVNEYKQGRVPRQEIKAAIKSIWGHSPESYMQLIDAALDQGIEVVFLDCDYERVDLHADNWQELEKQARDRREKHWLNVLTRQLEQHPGARMLVLVGSDHISPQAATMPLQSRLRQSGIAAASIAIAGGGVFYDDVLTRAARQGRLERSKFFVRLAPIKGAWQGMDFYLHLPQTSEKRKIFSYSE